MPLWVEPWLIFFGGETKSLSVAQTGHMLIANLPQLPKYRDYGHN